MKRIVGALPAVAGLADPGLRLLLAGWLAGFRSPRTRRAYAGDLVAWAGWCQARGPEVLATRRVQVDLHTTGLLEPASRRLSALSSFYRFTAGHDLLARRLRRGIALDVLASVLAHAGHPTDVPRTARWPPDRDIARLVDPLAEEGHSVE